MISSKASKGSILLFPNTILSQISQTISIENKKATDLGDSYNIYAQLRRVLDEADVPDRYDVLICDPPATESDHLYNAIYATRNLLIPVEPSWKGQASIDGLEQMATNFADELNIDVGVFGAVPLGYKDTIDQREMIENVPFSIPEVIGERAALMEGCWKQQCSAFRYVRDHRAQRRDYEIDTLAQFDKIARHLEESAGIEASNPPKPGEINEAEVKQ